MKPLISVIVPAHNVDPWIDDALWSIRRQTEHASEIIVIDDHSDDATRTIAERHASEDRRIRVVSNRAFGSGSARNTGIEIAQGEFLAFADADDLVPDHAYARLMASMTSDVDLVAGDYVTFATRSSWRRSSNLPIYSDRANLTLFDEPRLLRDRVVWNKLFRRTFWDEHGIRFPDATRANDIAPMTSALIHARLATIADPVYIYRKRPGGSSMTAAGTQLRGLRDYFHEENRCSSLVVSTGNERLARTYFSFLLAHDVWSHFRNVLTLLQRSDDEITSAHELIGLVREILQKALVEDWKHLSDDQVWRYRLVAVDRPELIKHLPVIGHDAAANIPTAAEYEDLVSALGTAYVRQVGAGVLVRNTRKVLVRTPSEPNMRAAADLVSRVGEPAALDSELRAAILTRNIPALCAIDERDAGNVVEVASLRQGRRSIEVRLSRPPRPIDTIMLRRRGGGGARVVPFEQSVNEIALEVDARDLSFGHWDMTARTLIEGTPITYPIRFGVGVVAPNRRRRDLLYVLTAEENKGRFTIGRKRSALMRLAHRAYTSVRRIRS